MGEIMYDTTITLEEADRVNFAPSFGEWFESYIDSLED